MAQLVHSALQDLVVTVKLTWSSEVSGYYFIWHSKQVSFLQIQQIYIYILYSMRTPAMFYTTLLGETNILASAWIHNFCKYHYMHVCLCNVVYSLVCMFQFCKMGLCVIVCIGAYKYKIGQCCHIQIVQTLFRGAWYIDI